MPKGKEKFDSLEDYISKIVKVQSDEIKEEDAKKIIEAIMPKMSKLIDEKIELLFSDIDQLIANKVKEHFCLIGKYVSEKFTLYKE